MSRRWQSPRALLAVALLGGLGLGTAYWQSGAVGQEPRSGDTVQAERPAIKQKQVQQAEQLSAAFRHAAEVAMPCTVTVRSKSKAHPVTRQGAGRGERGENPFKGTPFEDFFGGDDFGNGIPRQGQRREGMGSGVIVDKAGIVLTNNHVVEGADEVVVHLADGREFKAEEIKTDPDTDLAVLRIKGAGSLSAATLGDSDEMRIGDWVVAVGNPFELEQTVSAGIISGKGRELGSIRRAKFLQTDAAINPGNSGGPLVNLEGEVIGINTAIATNNGSFQGIGFAIPSNLAKWVMGQLIHKGSVERAYLGVAIGEVNKDLADKFGVHRGEGVLVAEVFPHSPAADAGFKEGDVVVEFDGHKVHNPRELQERVERVPLGSHQKITVLRDGHRETLDVVAKALPKDLAGNRQRGPAGDDTDDSDSTYESSKLGIQVSELTPDLAESLGYQGFSGVLINKVDPQGVAAEQGLRKGMLIMKVGKQPVKNVEQFRAATKDESLQDGVLLLVRTKTGNRFVVLQEAQQ